VSVRTIKHATTRERVRHLGQFNDAFWELGLDLAPLYTLESGMNWAHTNSPLPE
jgi:hypothetical protein